MEVKAVDSTIKNVMDLYYSWLVNLVGPKGGDRVGLLGTITVHDIEKPAPLYTNYVYRQFADRTFTVSPEDFGPGNTNDRYSVIYDRLVAVAAAKLYAEADLTAEQANKIDAYQGDITEAITEIRDIRRESLNEWKSYSEAAGLKPGTPQYDLEKAKFYQPYIELLKTQRQKITRSQAKKRAIWLSVFSDDADARRLSDVYENCLSQDNQQSLPTDMDIEGKYGLDPITIGAAADSGMFAFETSLGLLPSGTLTKVLDLKGARDATFTNEQKETHNHDREWHASTSGGWGLWSASASASEETHFRQSISDLESISIECDFMGEYWVNRRNWFDSTVFGNKYLADVLKNDPRAATLMANVISSLIIVRGLRVTYKFLHEDDTLVWSSYNYRASGSYGFFGVGASLGGGSSGSDLNHVINKKDKTVTFFDGPDVCRLLALRVSKVLEISDETIALLNNPLENTVLGQKTLESWSNRKVAPGILSAG